MKIKSFNVTIKLILVLLILQMKQFSFSQKNESCSYCYVVSFNPVYSSGLIDISYVSFEELYLIVSPKPISIDSITSVLSKDLYTSKQSILDSMKNYFMVYQLIENEAKAKRGKNINKHLTDCDLYGRRFLFNLNEPIRGSSSVVGFVVSRFIMTNHNIMYKIVNKGCDPVSNDECRAIITSL